MAQGRMINRAICVDKAVNNLTSDFHRLVFTWLIVLADREGRVLGDPAVVRSTLFPRRDDITIAQIEAALRDIAENDLIIWYETDNDMFIWFPSFEKNQVGMRKEKEAPSRIPPPSDDCRIVAGKGTELVRTKDVLGTEKDGVREWNEKELSGENPPEEEVKQQTRQPSEHQVMQADLEKYFSGQTGLPLPSRKTERQKKAGATQWWNPLHDILEMCEWDIGRAKCLTGAAVTQLRTKKLIIADVNSIMKTVKALSAEGIAAGSNGRNCVKVEI